MIIGLTLGISAFTPLIIVLTASKVTRVIPIRGTWEADINKFSKKRLLILLRHHGRHLWGGREVERAVGDGGQQGWRDVPDLAIFRKLPQRRRIKKSVTSWRWRRAVCGPTRSAKWKMNGFYIVARFRISFFHHLEDKPGFVFSILVEHPQLQQLHLCDISPFRSFEFSYVIIKIVLNIMLVVSLSLWL